MINLLSPESKRQIRAARMNVTLYRYCILITATAMLLGFVFAVGFWASMNDKQLADAAKQETQNAAQEYAKTKAAAEAFAKDLATAKNILGGNVSFTDLILNIAGVVPSGVVLNNLSLGSTTTTTTTANAPIDISGRAVSYNQAVALKNSLENSPIFERVSINNVSQTDTSGQVSALAQKYPFSITLKAQFSKPSTAGNK